MMRIVDAEQSRCAMVPLVYSSQHLQHQPSVEYFHSRLLPYPETPERVQTIHRHLQTTGLVTVVEPDYPLERTILEQTHDHSFLDWFQELSQNAQHHLADLSPHYQVEDRSNAYLYPAVFPTRPNMKRLQENAVDYSGYYAFDIAAPIGPGTWEAAVYAATAAHKAADLLLSQSSQVAYALCRPPGHHAGHDYVGGYCYLNNAAVAANKLLTGGKVAVLDIDYHHGNGTQDIFWDEPGVFVGSIHADPRHEYPYYAGYADEIGGDRAQNANRNIPLPLNTSGPRYLLALDDLLEATSRFEPEWLVISLGFDTFVDDPTTAFRLEVEHFHQMGTAVAGLSLPTLFVQEGGYNTAVNGHLAEQVFRGFLGA